MGHSCGRRVQRFAPFAGELGGLYTAVLRMWHARDEPPGSSPTKIDCMVRGITKDQRASIAFEAFGVRSPIPRRLSERGARGRNQTRGTARATGDDTFPADSGSAEEPIGPLQPANRSRAGS